MKAYYSTAYGGPEVAHFGDFPDPVLKDNQLLIEVKAVSINPVDYKVKRGSARVFSGSKFPRIYGSDFAGIVKETGSKVTKFKAGDKVYGVTPVIWGKPGALCQLLAIDEKYALVFPENISFEEAAALPIAALTASNGLRRCGVKKGTNLLINGGTGGVGHFAIQFAREIGAHITVTCSNKNSELAKKLGADETMGYTREAFVAANKQFDVILDAYGHMKFADINLLLKRGGSYASTMIKPFLFFTSLFVKLAYRKRLTSSNLRANPEDVAEMENLFHQKKLVPLIENYFTLEQAAEAFHLAEFGSPRGKIIVKI